MRRFAVALGTAVLAWPLAALAQTPPDTGQIRTLNDAVFVGSGHLAVSETAAPPPAIMDAGAARLAETGVTPGNLRLNPSASASPGLVDLSAGPVGIRLSPWSAASPGADRQAEGLGAAVKLQSAQGAVLDRLEAMGIKDGRTAYGDSSRFYLFAAVRGQAVGLNMLGGSGGLHRAGWSTDATSALVGDGQVGIGWRKGGVEAALGYVHRGIHVRNAPLGASDSYADDMGAFSLTFHPHW